ncbi:glycosyltransferase [Microbacterium sp. ASV49]|uniref:Glycosyltransferase n=1 Tax=Microbacterium candidum TaxID=3041922 RepID=A0ABT7N0S9_9MICO|nr:glycosyltransferase [Microbacterium sp. ASV49]MDL9980319.1 glycosyltransferase [Microbacterium sp. ASV49]
MVFPVEGTGTRAAGLYLRGDADATGRRAARIRAHGRGSFATYFNAFPIGIWRSAAGVDVVTVRLESSAAATHRVVGIGAAGNPRTLTTVDGAGSLTLELGAVPEDATWLWLETDSGAEPVVVSDVDWLVVAPQPLPSRITVSITTMDRVDDCAAVVDALADDELRDTIAEVIVVDQGRESVSSSVPQGRLGNGVPVRVIEQDNLGGSGGFSRGMLEAVHADATHVLLLDDDVRIEPESIRRLASLAAVARDAPLLGAQMLSLIDPTVLHSMGDEMDRRTMWWQAVEPSLVSADLLDHPIESTPALRRFRPVDFNGWWMCLIPIAVVRRIGASMPFFIKWDDAEYGLRAAEAGHRTVTVPGVALWHVPWTAKDDGLDWQAYYQLRNRIVTALLHSRRPRRVLSATWMQDVNHILCLQYGSVHVRIAALRDILAGPDELVETLRGGRARAQRELADAGQVVVDLAGLKTVDVIASAPRGTVRSIERLMRVIVHQLTPARRSAEPLARVPRRSGKWWRLGLMDEVALESAAGRGAFHLRRSRREALRLLAVTVALRIRIWFRWRRLAARYRDAGQRLAGEASWRRIYADTSRTDRV